MVNLSLVTSEVYKRSQLIEVKWNLDINNYSGISLKEIRFRKPN